MLAISSLPRSPLGQSSLLHVCSSEMAWDLWGWTFPVAKVEALGLALAAPSRAAVWPLVVVDSSRDAAFRV